MPDTSDSAFTPTTLPDPTDYTCPFSDHIFATKHGVDLRLRLWPSPVNSPSPWLLWSHGGAFLFGMHEEVTPWVVPLLLRRGIHVVSFSYRFAPQASLEDIIDDANDAYAWCRAHLPTFLGTTVALDSYAVAGDSAGGTIAGLLAQTLTPPPRAFLANHALLDLADPFFRTRGDNVELSGEFDEAEVIAAAQDNDPAHAIITCPSPGRIGFGQGALRRAFHSLTLVVGRRQHLQGDVFTLLNRGNWIDAVLRGGSNEEKHVYAERHSPLRLLGGRGSDGVNGVATNGVNGHGEGNGTRSRYPHPPTYFLHGEADAIVPVEQSRDMAKRLRELGVPVGEYYEPGAGHVFDQRFSNRRVKGYDECCSAAVDFLEVYLRQ
ncbi:alpha/beta-hydrolase [Cutaneotrichosporon oleaginosum]|uniref:Alpha/beta-hydrolase n=1 Tax=Cutaneotrichosporon oleaginosum TaxID=879819 RepID=A0A0J0XYB4_9TREE|nr:alpha/beta-hydrolase [Cutaneotrichosporon oleaginosum]KLT46035.1 alpha/beta-hydrolase [Cutaneotrichosporon oleaginosum]TXT06729.1 hypothetical protein COLE_06060 [Cutaneotrichosporon oleaginosum]